MASICGPKTWQMCYEVPNHPLQAMLGTNPWVDFSVEQPVLLDHPLVT
jgi:hypothetical protein